jgi:hypothetical protein
MDFSGKICDQCRNLEARDVRACLLEFVAPTTEGTAPEPAMLRKRKDLCDSCRQRVCEAIRQAFDLWQPPSLPPSLKAPPQRVPDQVTPRPEHDPWV